MKKVILILLSLLLLSSCNKNTSKEEINVLNWSSYIPNEIIENFQKETGIKVNYNTYSSNEELLAKLSSSKEGTYDLVFPSDYMVEIMIRKNMLEKIDKTKLINYSNINNLFLNQPYDKNNDYSIPFLAATTVIAYNTSNIKEDINSYNDLQNKKYKNDMVLIDDQRIIIGTANLATNSDFNEIDSKKLKQSKKWLLNLKNNIKAYDSDSPKTFLITDEVNIGLLWNAEAVLASQINPNIKIVYPIEGHAISVDNYVIIKNSKHIENTYKFIDYLLSKDINKLITDAYPYINTTYSGMNLEDKELYNIITTGNYVKNIDDKITLYDKMWAEIK